MAKNQDDNTGKSLARTELPDSSKKFGNLTLNIRKRAGEEKGDLVESHEYEDRGQIVARYVKKDGKVLQSAATQDAQESGAHEKAAKKAGVKAKDVVFTTPTMNAVQDYVEQHQDKDTPNPEGEKAELTGKTKEKKPKSKPSEGKKPDTSMSKMTKEKTGQADKPGDRDIRKDIEKDRSLEKTDKIEDLASKRASMKAALERKSKGNTKLTRLLEIVKKISDRPPTDYNPADASDAASKIRSHHYTSTANKPLDKAAVAEPFHDPAAHAKDAKLEAALQEKVQRHLTDVCLKGNLQQNEQNPLKKADDPLKPAGPGDPLKEMVGKQKFEGRVKEGLASYTSPEKKARPQRDTLPKTPKYKLLTHMESNAKTAKNASVQDQGKNVFSAILHLAPATLAGAGNVCESATEGCKDACLNTAGRGGMFKAGENTNTIQNARIRKTKYLAENPGAFMDDLLHDVQQVQRHAAASGAKPVVRLNGTSDLAWENFPLPQHGGKNIFDAFPDVQFYDYTKHPGRVLSNKRPNYHLTFSLAESNENMAKRVLAAGHNVAAVFGGKKLPGKYLDHPVISGDEHDLRFLDPRGVGHVIGLTAKGEAKGDTSGFVKWGHEGDPEAKPSGKAPVKRGQVAGQMKKSEENMNDLEKNYDPRDDMDEVEVGSTMPHAKAYEYHAKMAAHHSKMARYHEHNESKHDDPRHDSRLSGAHDTLADQHAHAANAAKAKLGKTLPPDQQMAKDDKPHPAGSPEYMAHEVEEHDLPLKRGLSGLTHEKMAQMLAHLRTLKDPSQHRSPENKNPDKLKKEDYSHTENLDPNTGNPIHGYDSGPQPEMQGVAPKAPAAAAPDKGLAGNINAAGAKAMGKSKDGGKWPVPGLVPPKRDNAKLKKDDPPSTFDGGKASLEQKGTNAGTNSGAGAAQGVVFGGKSAKPEGKPLEKGGKWPVPGLVPPKRDNAKLKKDDPPSTFDGGKASLEQKGTNAGTNSGAGAAQGVVFGGKSLTKGMAPTKSEMASGSAMNPKPKVGAVKPSGDAYSQRPRPMSKAIGAPAAPAQPAKGPTLPTAIVKPKNPKPGNTVMVTNMGFGAQGMAGAGGMGKSEDQPHHEAPKHLQGQDKADWHTAQHEFHKAHAQEAEHEESRHDGQPVPRRSVHAHWARYHAIKAKESLGKSVAPAVPDLKKHVPGVSDKKFDSCVSQVKKKGTGNAYAICTASLKKAMEHMRNGSQPLEKGELCQNGDNPLEKAHPQNGSQPLEKAVVDLKTGKPVRATAERKAAQAPKPVAGAGPQATGGAGTSAGAKAEAAVFGNGNKGRGPAYGAGPSSPERIKSSMEKINGLMAHVKSMHSEAPGAKPSQNHQPGAPMPKANAKAPGQGGKAPQGRDAKIRAALDKQKDTNPYASPAHQPVGAKGPPKANAKYEEAKKKQQESPKAPLKKDDLDNDRGKANSTYIPGSVDPAPAPAPSNPTSGFVYGKRGG